MGNAGVRTKTAGATTGNMAKSSRPDERNATPPLNPRCEMYSRPDAHGEPGRNYGMSSEGSSDAPYTRRLSRGSNAMCKEKGAKICTEEDAGDDCSLGAELVDLAKHEVGAYRKV